MQVDLQLILSAFDQSGGPVCKDQPESNGFRLLCYHCPFSERHQGILVCSRFNRKIGARSKYGLPAWKKIREEVMERDRYTCGICGSSQDLHVHHLDYDPTHDNPSNLITLCSHCHARVHTGLNRGEEIILTAAMLPVRRA